MIEDDELGREAFGLLTDRLRDGVLQRQVSIINENQRLAERKQKRERKEGSAYITLNPMGSPGRPQGTRSGIETDLTCGEVEGPKLTSMVSLMPISTRPSEIVPNILDLVHILHLCYIDKLFISFPYCMGWK